jgi:hypothetical protein
MAFFDKYIPKALQVFELHEKGLKSAEVHEQAEALRYQSYDEAGKHRQWTSYATRLHNTSKRLQRLTTQLQLVEFHTNPDERSNVDKKDIVNLLAIDFFNDAHVSHTRPRRTTSKTKR